MALPQYLDAQGRLNQLGLDLFYNAQKRQGVVPINSDTGLPELEDKFNQSQFGLGNSGGFASALKDLMSQPGAVSANPAGLNDINQYVGNDLKSLSAYGLQGSDIQSVIDALNSAGINLSGTGFSPTASTPSTTGPATPGISTPGQTGGTNPATPISPTNPPAPVVPTPTTPQAPYTGAQIPFSPQTPGSGPSLPYPLENNAVTSSPNQQAIINQQQQQANLINQIMQQIPSLISQQQTAQKGLATDALGLSNQNTLQQQQQMSDLINKNLQQEMQNLSTGPEGEAFREQYNNLGLLNSGAFNQGLANQFGRIAQQGERDTAALGLQGLQNQQGILNSLYGTQSGLGTSGLNRLFGLQDTGTQAVNDLGTSSLSELFGAENQAAANALAQSIASNQYRQQQNQGIGSLIGGGLGAGLGFLSPLGPMGGFLGASLGSSLGGSIGSLF